MSRASKVAKSLATPNAVRCGNVRFCTTLHAPDERRPGPGAFRFPLREARAYFDAAARRRISDSIVFTRAESLAPFASASTWRASLFREVARAAPLCFSAASSDLAIAEVLSLARPSLRTSWSRYERTTGNAAGQTSFGWLCG